MIDAALISYVGVMSVTPGPNNLLLAASGVHFGFRRTVPQMLGISVGHFLQVFLATLAFAVALSLFAVVRPYLGAAGCLYLLVLSWQIATAGPPEEREGRRPLRWWESMGFQFVNPKAWVMVTNVALLFTPRDVALLPGALGLAGVCALINLPCIALWALLGDRLRRVLAGRRAALAFNLGMGLLMAATALWLLYEEVFAR